MDQTDVNTHLIFDPIDLTWSDGAPLPTARNSACSVTQSGKLHTIGGRTVADGNLANHEAYHFETKEWQTLPPFPQAQGGLACAVFAEKIYVFGGEFFNNGGGVYEEVWAYDTSKDAWEEVAKMPNPRHGLGALTADRGVYVVGGALKAGGNETSNIMSVFVPQSSSD